jgi:hypothetical protein
VTGTQPVRPDDAGNLPLASRSTGVAESSETARTGNPLAQGAPPTSSRAEQSIGLKWDF